MTKKHSLGFWITFWMSAAVLLSGWYLFLEWKKDSAKSLEKATDFLPIGEEKKERARAISAVYEHLSKKDDRQRTFLVLLQNSMELRPGGGYIGSFAVAKVKNSEVEDFQIHDTGNFDGRIPDGIEPPYPMKSALKIDSWKFRDSNWSPDFTLNALKAEEFYRLGAGEEELDGVLAVNADVLSSLLRVIGPVDVPSAGGEYNFENAVFKLENQVEKDFYSQGIAVGDRKAVMNDLAGAIFEKIGEMSLSQKFDLAKALLFELDNKNIQIYFNDGNVQAQIEKAGWAGKFDSDWNYDYLMLVDANLSALKSDYWIRRSFDYRVDLSREKPSAVLKVSYSHEAQKRDFMTTDYQTYLRVFVPKGSWLSDDKKLNGIRFGEDLGRKFFGTLLQVPLSSEKTFEFRYELPSDFREKPYDLLIQRQSGSGKVDGQVTVIERDGAQKIFQVDLEKDWILSEN